MKRQLTLALTVLVLFGRLGEAQEINNEASFHEAYLLEVVEGRVAEAAREYVRIMDAEGAERALRGEARFRFAVCCVLLGRADEARTQLERILGDESIPDVLRKRAQEYRTSLDGVGVGSELDKRLNELAFEMGRERFDEGKAPPAAYREFQVIGKPAVPFLLELLAHPDADLRQHAFRVLCRMDEPGMAGRWDMWRFPSPTVQRDLSDYCFRHEDERAVAERMILDAAPKDRGNLLSAFSRTSNFSVALPRGIAAAGGEEKNALAAARKTVPAEATLALRLEWLMGDNEQLSVGAAIQLCSSALSGIPEELGRPEVFRTILKRLVGQPLGWPIPGNLRIPELVPMKGVRAFADAMPTQVVLAELRGILAVSADWDGPAELLPLATGLPSPLAASLDERDLTADELTEYEGLLESWIEAAPASTGRPDPWFPSHLIKLLERIPEERVSLLLTHVANHRGRESVTGILRDWSLDTARDIPILAAALETSWAGEHDILLGKVPYDRRGKDPLDEGIARAFASSSTRIGEAIADWALPTFHDCVRAAAAALPADEGTDLLASAIPRLAGVGDSHLSSTVRRLIYLTPDASAEFRVAVFNAMPRMVALGGERVLTILLNDSISMLRTHDSGAIPLGADLPKLTGFILDHIESLPSGYYSQLIPHLDLFPLDAWAAHAPAKLWSTGLPSLDSLTPDIVDPAARLLTESPDDLNESVLALIRTCASPGARREILERLILGGGEMPVFILPRLPDGGAALRAEVMEEALTICLGEDDPHLQSVAALAANLAQVRPTEKLFPAVRALLESSDRAMVLSACSLATQLGREDLLPDLVGLLDSMDFMVRSAAQAAMDSILELRKLKEDAKRSIGESSD